MPFEDLVRKTWERDILFTVLLELTYRCNLDCFFCYNDLKLRGRPLSREDYLRLFQDLREMEVMHLVLTGGEPLSHPDFLVLGAKARELGFVIRIKSNGHALRGDLARRIKEKIQPFLVEVSLHGARAATHERQTRVSGSFDRLLANLQEMLALGLRVKLNATLTAYNENEAEEMFSLADRLGVPLRFDPEVTPRDDGDRSVLAVSASAEGLSRLFRLQAERARGASSRAATPEILRRGEDAGLTPAAGKHCGAGSSGLAIDPYGNVYPCVQWRRPVGNLHQASIREIWHGSEGLVEVRRITGQAANLVASYGPRGAWMAFCPGAAAMNTGSPLRVHAAALQRMELAVGAGREIALPVLA